MTLNARQAAFVAEYAVDGNATAAAQRAGYSKKTAHAQGCRLLKDADVAAAIAADQVKRAQRLELRADDVLREFMRLGFSDIGAAFERDDNGRVRMKDLDKIPEEARRAISSVKVRQEGSLDAPAYVTEVKLWDKPAALTALGKHLKLFVEKLEVDAKLSLAELIVQARQRKVARK